MCNAKEEEEGTLVQSFGLVRLIAPTINNINYLCSAEHSYVTLVLRQPINEPTSFVIHSLSFRPICRSFVRVLNMCAVCVCLCVCVCSAVCFSLFHFYHSIRIFCFFFWTNNRLSFDNSTICFLLHSFNRIFIAGFARRQSSIITSYCIGCIFYLLHGKFAFFHLLCIKNCKKKNYCYFNYDLSKLSICIVYIVLRIVERENEYDFCFCLYFFYSSWNKFKHF